MSCEVRLSGSTPDGRGASVRNLQVADAPEIGDLREGERSLSNLWFQYHERRLSVEESIPVDDALRARVRREFPVPAQLDFRMSADPPVSS